MNVFAVIGGWPKILTAFLTEKVTPIALNPQGKPVSNILNSTFPVLILPANAFHAGTTGNLAIRGRYRWPASAVGIQSALIPVLGSFNRPVDHPVACEGGWNAASTDPAPVGVPLREYHD